jgi:hypothetical protein
MAALGVAGAVVAACGENTPPPNNLDGTSEGGQKDIALGEPLTPDAPLWPDIGQQDIGQDGAQPDSYKKSTFGCKSDLDCFGQKCCPTPWGVNLCAPTCFPK